MDKLTPIANNIVVKLDKAEEEVKSSGIVIPVTAVNPPLRGIVISVGYNIRNGQKVPITSVAPGDKILIGMYSGVEFFYHNIEYRYMKESEIIGIINDYEQSKETIAIEKLLNDFSEQMDNDAKEILYTLTCFARTPYEYLNRGKQIN